MADPRFSPREQSLAGGFLAKFQGWFTRLPVVVFASVVLFGLWSAVYTLPAESEAVVTRFGKYDRTVTPGLRFKLPWGIEGVRRVPVKRQLKVEFGFGTPGASNPHQSTSTAEQAAEKRMVT